MSRGRLPIELNGIAALVFVFLLTALIAVIVGEYDFAAKVMDVAIIIALFFGTILLLMHGLKGS